jgi:acyl-CoA thioesterase-1
MRCNMYLTPHQDRRIAMIWRIALLILTLCLSQPARAEGPRILVMGDSLMAMNRLIGGSVAQALGDALGVQVQDQSVPGARIFFPVPVLNAAGLKIRSQLTGGPWDFVVMNGGGNDLLFGCGCGTCTRMMNRLITPDGTTGAIPDLVADLRSSGAKVIFTGYMRTPGVISPVESCGPLGDEMDRRLTLMAARDEGVSFVLLSDLVTQDGDRSYHGIDMVHPSVKGSRAIAARVAVLIRK